MSKPTTLAKYRIQIKERKKVTTAPTDRNVSDSQVHHGIDGSTFIVKQAASTTVQATAREVIARHKEVIKRLAKR